MANPQNPTSQPNDSPVTETTPSQTNSTAASARPGIRRRGALAGVAALVAGALAKASERVAQAAGDGAFLTMGNNDSTTNNPASTTRLARANPSFNTFTALEVSNPAGGALEATTTGTNLSQPAIRGAAVSGGLGVEGRSGGGAIVAPVKIGVHGSSINDTGVAGTANHRPGVVGVAKLSIAVADFPTTRVGVHGVADTGPGVQGISTSAHGVFGQTSATAGTVVGGLLAAGLTGRTGQTIALYGYSDGPPNPSYAPIGAVGQCENGFGVWGLSSAGPGATSRPGGGTVTALSGVLGTSTSGLGVYAISSGSYALAADGNGPSTVGALIRGLGGAQAAVFVGNVEIQGHLTVSGGVNGPVGAQTTPSAAGVPTGESSPALVEAVGRGQVERGVATVALDPTVAAQGPGADYDVFLTSYDNVQLHVANRTAQSFEVRVTEGTGRAAEIAAGRATAGFSYRVVARRRPGAGSQRADAAPLHVPTIPTPQGVPTLPTAKP
jgi:hypothetical protein